MGFIFAEILNSYPKLRENFELLYNVLKLLKEKSLQVYFYEKFEVHVNNTRIYFRTLPNSKSY